MTKKARLILVYVVATMVLCIAADYFLNLDIDAAAGDPCTCMCDENAIIGCDHVCKTRGGCLLLESVGALCDSSATACNNSYQIVCVNEPFKVFTFYCSVPCSLCDETFWQ